MEFPQLGKNIGEANNISTSNKDCFGFLRE